MSSENYRIQKQDSVYFLTFTVTDWVDVFTRMNYRNITTEMIDARINYIHENPVRTGLVARAEEYLYSSARNYASLSGIIEIDMI